jgi:hypothetical protein
LVVEVVVEIVTHSLHLQSLVMVEQRQMVVEQVLQMARAQQELLTLVAVEVVAEEMVLPMQIP